ncbi:MAG TPA: helix-turn-helix domain-containing GNAT family N-acetyltransferase [Xanthobacteraceae bacterium]|nr:helix-turn-helix domain-containing GNAT family N-acetyltransferase [Xanthobacteraceae bacterium]
MRAKAATIPDAAAADSMDDRVAAVRRFSRFYSRRLGMLQDAFLQTSFSLAEARVLYELAHRDKPTATAVADALGIDRGYLSRILRSFSERGLVAKSSSRQDGRQSLLSLTARGRQSFTAINERSQKDVSAMLEKLSRPDQDRVVAAMGAIERLIGKETQMESSYVVRPPRSGEMGWVVARHAVLYGQEYGWGAKFEGLCAEIVAQMIAQYDPARDRHMIADVDGEPVGSAFVVKDSDDVARLRLLLVEPKARGLGIGKRLVDECVAFARGAGYGKMTLWTHSCLAAARGIYKKAGFEKIAEKAHNDWGVDVVGETWERAL